MLLPEPSLKLLLRNAFWKGLPSTESHLCSKVSNHFQRLRQSLIDWEGWTCCSYTGLGLQSMLSHNFTSTSNASLLQNCKRSVLEVVNLAHLLRKHTHMHSCKQSPPQSHLRSSKRFNPLAGLPTTRHDQPSQHDHCRCPPASSRNLHNRHESWHTMEGLYRTGRSAFIYIVPRSRNSNMSFMWRIN